MDGSDLLPIRYGRMARSPFTFLRGSATLMAYDLSSTRTTGLTVQLAGDAHLANFGMFATPERDPVFDVNDFDETLPGPWEWDLKRLVTSFVVAGRENGLSRDLCRKASRRVARAYRQAMARFAGMRYLDVWYSRLDLATSGRSLSRQSRRLIDRSVLLAHRRTGFHAFPKLVRAVRGEHRIRDVPPLLVHYQDPERGLDSRASYARYLASLPDERRMLLERYHVVDVAQKVVGVGSVGTACSVLLLLADNDLLDPLFLQLKQAQTSALEPYLSTSPYDNHAQRVVVGQHLIQEASDIFLGWSRLRSTDFYVRQLRDMKFAFEFAALGTKALVGHAELCGTALARAHARTGDPAQISGYLGDSAAFDEVVTRFAETYAGQVARDHKALVAAIKRGRLPAKLGL